MKIIGFNHWYVGLSLIAALLWSCNKKEDNNTPSPIAPTSTDSTLIAPTKVEQKKTVEASLSMQQEVSQLNNNIDDFLRGINVGLRESGETGSCKPILNFRGVGRNGYDSLIELEYKNTSCGQGASVSGKIKVYFTKGKKWTFDREVSSYKDSIVYEDVETKGEKFISRINGFYAFELKDRKLLDSIFVDGKQQQKGYWLKRYAGVSQHHGNQTHVWISKGDTSNFISSYSGTSTYNRDSTTYSAKYNYEYNKRKYSGESINITSLRSCNYWFPVKGISKWIFTDKDQKVSSMVIDYGNGSCDRTVTTTYMDGSTESGEY